MHEQRDEHKIRKNATKTMLNMSVCNLTVFYNLGYDKVIIKLQWFKRASPTINFLRDKASKLQKNDNSSIKSFLDGHKIGKNATKTMFNMSDHATSLFSVTLDMIN